MNLPPQTVIQKEVDQVTLDLVMTPSLDAFRDHFPEHPILPGVVQIDWVVKLARQHLALDLPSARDFQVKFRSIIRPDMTVSLHLKYDKILNHLSFEYRHKNEIMSSGQIKLESKI